MSLDHVIPISAGGEHSKANTQLAHLGCNAKKQAKIREPQQLALIG
jgi:5-methylcytosine-specific restriction endonuclease McrA